MVKKLVAAVVAAVLALGVVALVAGPASAHHNTISAKAACLADGSYTVTWTVTNSESNKSSEVTSSNRDDVTVGTQFTFSETKTFTETVATAQDITLTLGAKWSNGYTATNSGKISKGEFPTDGCKTAQAQVIKTNTVCDAPGQPSTPTYTLVAVEGVEYYINGVKTAAGTYDAVAGETIHFEAKPADPSYKLVGETVGDWTPEVKDCIVTPTVVPPTDAQLCTAPGVVKTQYTIPVADGVIYSANIDGTETVVAAGTYDVPAGVTAYTIIARGDTANGYEIDGGSQIFSFTVKPYDGKCDITVTPKKTLVNQVFFGVTVMSHLPS